MQFTQAQRNDINEAIVKVEQQFDVRVLQVGVSSSHGFDFGGPDDPLELDFVYVHPRNRYLHMLVKEETKLSVYTNDGLKMVGTDLRRFVERLVGSNPSAQEFSRNELGLFRGTAGFCGALESLGQKAFNSASAAAYLNYADRSLTKLADKDVDLKEILLSTYMNLLICESIMDRGRFPHPVFTALLFASKWIKDNRLSDQLILLNGDRLYGRPSVISTALIDNAREYHGYLSTRYRAGQFERDPERNVVAINKRADKFLVEWINYFESERLKNA